MATRVLLSAFFFSSRRRHTRYIGDWSSDVCSSDLQRHGGEFDRQAACGEHAALHRLDQLGEMPVAVVEAAARVGDADHRPREHLARVAHALRKRAPQVERETRVAVIGETPCQALFHPQTSRATFMISSSLRRVSSCVSTCPPPPALENPHCGLMPRRSRGTYLEAAAICFFRKSLDSSTGVFVLTRPRITRLPLGTKRSGEKSPARALSYSRQ